MSKNLKKTSKKSNQQKFLFSRSLVVAMVAIIIASGAIYSVRTTITPTPLQIAEISNASGTINLSLNPTTNNLNIGEETSISLTYDVQANDGLSSIKAELVFDPTLVSISDIVISDKFPTKLASAKVVDNKITFTYGVGAPEEPDFISTLVTGHGTIATFKAKALKAGSVSVSISPSTLTLTKDGGDNNSLREITNTTINIVDPSASVAANPSTTTSSPSVNPSVEPSVEPSVSPSTTPSTKPIATPSDSPTIKKPDSPTNLRYNCYSNGSRITLRWDEATGATGYIISLDQKDGDNDTTTTSTRAEKDLDIKSNTFYTWKVAVTKDSVNSDPTTVSDIKCSGDSTNATPTPSPNSSPTPSPTPAPTKKSISQVVSNIFKPKSPSPSPKQSPNNSPVPLASFVPSSPISSPGSLSDIFASPSPELKTITSRDQTNLFSKIILGWQALFIRLVETLTK